MPLYLIRGAHESMICKRVHGGNHYDSPAAILLLTCMTIANKRFNQTQSIAIASMCRRNLMSDQGTNI